MEAIAQVTILALSTLIKRPVSVSGDTLNDVQLEMEQLQPRGQDNEDLNSKLDKLQFKKVDEVGYK
jgi:hypothetical protein